MLRSIDALTRDFSRASCADAARARNREMPANGVARALRGECRARCFRVSMHVVVFCGIDRRDVLECMRLTHGHVEFGAVFHRARCRFDCIEGSRALLIIVVSRSSSPVPLPLAHLVNRLEDGGKRWG